MMEIVIKESKHVKVTAEVSAYMENSETKKIIRIKEYYEGHLESDIAFNESEFQKINELIGN